MKNRYSPPILIFTMFAILLSGHLFATRWEVSVANFAFTPNSYPNVKVGDTVRFLWVNGSHTTTSTTIPAGAATWNHPMTSASTSFDYIPTVTGTYNYKCTPHAAMGMTGTFTVSVLTGIETQKATLSPDVYPNPVQNTATVRLASGQQSLKGLKLYDVTGKIVMTRDLEDMAQNESLTLDLGNLGSGIYFALFEDSDNGVTVKRIVKK